MSTTTPARTDHEVREAVEQELDWTPDVEALGIGVSVHSGAVTLSGEVKNHAERIAALHAALRVRGVTTVLDDITVHAASGWPVTETDIAKEVQRALRAATNVPESVKAEIDGHTVTLTGEVGWNFERLAAQKAVEYLRGVHFVDNRVSLTARPAARDVELRIKQAITRNALLDADTIHVTADGERVRLTGTVHSWAEKQQAGAIAWASPFASHVDNDILITI